MRIRTAVVPAVLTVLLAVIVGAFLWNWMGDDTGRATLVRGAGGVVFGVAMITLAIIYWRKRRP